MTEQQARELQIEIKVERWTDRIDARYMRGEFDESCYKAMLKTVSEWADQQYAAMQS